MNLSANRRQVIKLDLDEGEAHHLWHALNAAARRNSATIMTAGFARDLANALNVLLDLGHNEIKEND